MDKKKTGNERASGEMNKDECEEIEMNVEAREEQLKDDDHKGYTFNESRREEKLNKKDEFEASRNCDSKDVHESCKLDRKIVLFGTAKPKTSNRDSVFRNCDLESKPHKEQKGLGKSENRVHNTNDESCMRKSCWGFWSHVYDNTPINSNVAVNASINDILCDKRLIEAQVHVTGVPKYINFKSFQKLVKKRCGNRVKILNIKQIYPEWIIQLYRTEDAKIVEKALSGYQYNGSELFACTAEKPQNPLAYKTNPVNTLYLKQMNDSTKFSGELKISSLIWSNAQFQELKAFRSEAIKFFNSRQIRLGKIRLDEINWNNFNIKESSLIKDALLIWPTGLIRAVLPEVNSDVMDKWEPTIPSLIRNDETLTIYVMALLTRFGTQIISRDIVWKIFAYNLSISGKWIDNAYEVANQVGRTSAKVVVYAGHIFLFTDLLNRTIENQNSMEHEHKPLELLIEI